MLPETVVKRNAVSHKTATIAPQSYTDGYAILTQPKH